MPTALADSAVVGVYYFGTELEDLNGNAAATFNNQPATHLALAAPSFADDTGDDQSWTVGTAITAVQVPTAQGNPTPTYAVVGALPSGFSFNNSTRVLSGTPTAAGTGTIRIRATNSQGSDDWTVDYVTAAAGDTDPPVFQSATVDGDQLVLTYDEALDETVTPPNPRFVVMVDSVRNFVTAAVIAGETVTLTLTTAVTSGETVTVSYNRPTNVARRIRDVAGNDAVSFSNEAATNTAGVTDRDASAFLATGAPAITASAAAEAAVVTDRDAAAYLATGAPAVAATAATAPGTITNRDARAVLATGAPAIAAAGQARRDASRVKLWVQAPTLTGGPLTLYETGKPGRLYPARLASVTRRVDLYTGRDSVASAGTLSTTLDNRDGLFSADGLFSPHWRDVTLVAQVDLSVVLVARAEKTSEAGAGTQAMVQWRDLVDDFLAQQVSGVGGDETDAEVVASANLRTTLEGLGLPITGVPDLDLWLPEETTTLRKWLSPVLAAHALTIDWTATATASGDEIDIGFRIQGDEEFGNEAGLPRFTNAHLIGDPRWDSGRDQVFNLWTGRRRFYDTMAGRFQTEDLQARGRPAPFSTAVYSREHFGERKARLDLSQVRADAATITGIVDDIINQRAWPHSRGDFTLRGPEASALRLGDGLVTDFGLGIRAGRGLSRVWRVHGRTVDLLSETTKLYVEARDGRDADYESWRVAGANTEDAL